MVFAFEVDATGCLAGDFDVDSLVGDTVRLGADRLKVDADADARGLFDFEATEGFDIDLEAVGDLDVELL